MRMIINRKTKAPVIEKYRGYEYKLTTDLFGNRIILVFGVGEFNTLHDMVVYINDLIEQKRQYGKN